MTVCVITFAAPFFGWICTGGLSHILLHTHWVTSQGNNSFFLTCKLREKWLTTQIIYLTRQHYFEHYCFNWQRTPAFQFYCIYCNCIAIYLLMYLYKLQITRLTRNQMQMKCALMAKHPHLPRQQLTIWPRNHRCHQVIPVVLKILLLTLLFHC